ncbi:MAG: 6-phosphogluconolactonase, partial [Chitinophagaceae bacterium]|nr:6-phosphogluconolactonase [Chitinophagaceae bacterium]
MNIHTYPSTDASNIGIANWMVDYIHKTLAEKKMFTLALSGGNTPKA